MKSKIENTYTNPNKKSGLVEFISVVKLIEILKERGVIDEKDVRKIKGEKIKK